MYTYSKRKKRNFFFKRYVDIYIYLFQIKSVNPFYKITMLIYKISVFLFKVSPEKNIIINNNYTSKNKRKSMAINNGYNVDVYNKILHIYI